MSYAKPDDQDHELVDHLIAYRTVSGEVAEVMTSLRADFIALGHRIVDEVSRTPDRTVALRKLHDACQCAITALALNQGDQVAAP